MRSVTSELFLSLINRAAQPAATYVTLVVLGRILPTDEFSNYLISITVAMWAISSLFQWQKNATIRFFDHSEKDLTIYASSAVISALIALFAIFITNWLDPRVSVSTLFFIITTGLTYILGALLRSLGKTTTFLVTDTLGNLRWAFGMLAAFIFLSSNSTFIALSVGGALLAIALFIPLQKKGYFIRPPKQADIKNTKNLFQFGMYLIIIDFCGSGLMYIDRFWITDSVLSANYIISSNIGNQIASVILGAFLMVAYPRISKSYKDNNDWQATYRSYLKKFPLCAVFCCLISFVASPFLISLINDTLDPSPYLSVSFTAAQCAYYLVALLSIPYFITLKPIYPATFNFIAFIMYTSIGFYTFSDTTNPIIITSTKIALTLVLAFASWLFFKINNNPGKNSVI
jgi:O-antigen/teichoic acid export membrane protein